MALVNTQTLKGRQLDWAVAVALNICNAAGGDAARAIFESPDEMPESRPPHWLKHYSSSWNDGGHILDEYKMEFVQMRDSDYVIARIAPGITAAGHNILEAAMRVLVRDKIGLTLEIPDHILARLEPRVAE